MPAAPIVATDAFADLTEVAGNVRQQITEPPDAAYSGRVQAKLEAVR
jgi:hypothetical protein